MTRTRLNKIIKRIKIDEDMVRVRTMGRRDDDYTKYALKSSVFSCRLKDVRDGDPRKV